VQGVNDTWLMVVSGMGTLISGFVIAHLGWHSSLAGRVAGKSESLHCFVDSAPLVYSALWPCSAPLSTVCSPRALRQNQSYHQRAKNLLRADMEPPHRRIIS
jgi:hypothetical protein